MGLEGIVRFLFFKQIARMIGSKPQRQSVNLCSMLLVDTLAAGGIINLDSHFHSLWHGKEDLAVCHHH
jgi:hypothetical protein